VKPFSCHKFSSKSYTPLKNHFDKNADEKLSAVVHIQRRIFQRLNM